MKHVIAFCKATTLGGLFLLLPAILLLLLVAKAVSGVRSTAQMIMEAITGQNTVADEFPLVIAIGIVIALSFLLGLILISRAGKSWGSWVEKSVLYRIPGYGTLRALLAGIAQTDQEGRMKPALFLQAPEVKIIVVVTEDHGDGWATIFVPEVPNAATGTIQIVRKEMLEHLNLRLTEIGAVMQQWGVGTRKLLEKSGKQSPLPAAAPGDQVSDPSK